MGIIGEGEILAKWRITKTRQIKFQPNFMTTPTNTCRTPRTHYIYMYTYFQREVKDLHLPPGSCLKESEIEKANKLVKIEAENSHGT